MSEFEEIERLESVLLRYNNNLDFAIRNKNAMRQTKCKNNIRKTELLIEELEKEIPDSNDRLLEIITDLHSKINITTKEEKLIKLKTEKLQKQIAELVRPIEVEPEPELIPEQISIPEIIPEPIPELESEPEILEEGKDEIVELLKPKIKCTCGKEFETERGLKSHQSRWCINKEVKV